MNHILILSRSEERTLKSNARNTIQGDIKYNTNGIKEGSSKNIDLLKAKIDLLKGTAESSGATRFSNTSVDVHEIIVTNARNGKLLQANMRNKIRHKKAILCDTLKIFSKGTAHESRRIPVSNLKTLSG